MQLDHDKIESIFSAVLEIDSEAERQAYLNQACGDDVELRKQVAALIENHRLAGSSFLAHQDLTTPGGLRTPTPVDVAIGPYRLQKKIGEGGMGVVYLAEQVEPVRRQVVVKIMKFGIDSPGVVSRFELERQALAVMDHANIAKVIDGGSTVDGRPWFAMEWIQGVRITDFCDDHRMTIQQRLELFVSVCRAVQHAHQRGIIHRDLKPSNVLVAEIDGRPVPKVIDFGVAKAIGPELTSETLNTHSGSIIGTLEYMSPEQAMPSADGIDTRCDIYCLGVVLYELLTATTPLQRRSSVQTPVIELLRVIRDVEPPKPSDRVSSLEDLTAVAANRGLGPTTLSQRIKGDLDWIVMKCLEKDRGRRYATVNSLIRDVERYFNDEPLEAGPPTASYKLRKFVRKYRMPLAFAGTIFALLIGAAIGGSLLAIRATRAERLAVEEASIATAVNEFLLDDLLAYADTENQPLDIPRNIDITARELVDRAARRVEQRFRGQDRTEAAIQFTLGKTYLSLGEYRKAKTHLNRAIDLRDDLLGATHPDTLVCMSHLAHACVYLQEFDKAEQLYRFVMENTRREMGNDHRETLQTIRNLAEVLIHRDQFEEAESLLHESIHGFRKQLGENHFDTLHSIEKLGNLYVAISKNDEAESLLRQALAGYQKHLGPDHPSTLRARVTIADLTAKRGEAGLAESSYREVLAAIPAALGKNRPATLDVMAKLGMMYRTKGRYAEAEPLLKQAVEGYRTLENDQNESLLIAMNNLAVLYRDQGRFDEAAPLFEEVVAGWTAKRGPNDRETLNGINNMAMLHLSSGRPKDAEPLLRNVVERTRLAFGPDNAFTLVCLANLGGFCTDTGKYDEAEPLFRQVLKARQRTLGEEHVDTIASMNHVALALKARKEFLEAESLFEQVLKARREKLGPEHPDTLRTMNNLAILFRDTDRLDQADTLFRQILDMRRDKLGPDHPDTLLTLYHFALLEQQRGQVASAVSMLGEAVEGANRKLGPEHPQTKKYIEALKQMDDETD